jgi:hypothetical protein
MHVCMHVRVSSVRVLEYIGVGVGVYGLCIDVYPGMYRLIPGRCRFYTGRLCVVVYCCVCLFLSMCVCLSICETSAHSSRAGHLGDYELALLEEKTHGTQL